jgi:putative DNA methylase
VSERRLIEDFLPLRCIGQEAGREKNAGRSYHPSTLHWWWARRPLAAARAAVLATLVPTSAFPHERERIESFFTELTTWRGGELGVSEVALREARELIADEWPDRPRVLDSFMGAGTIPLEVLRLGGDAVGLELNPVAFMVAMGTVVWPQQYGPTLADDVDAWGEWVARETFAEVAALYPPVHTAHPPTEQLDLDGEQASDGEVPAAYFWTRTVRCPNPALDPHDVPLTRLSHVARTRRKRIAIQMVPDQNSRRVTFRLVPEQAGAPTTPRGKSSASSCPVCGASISPDYLKEQGKRGGIGRQLMAVAMSPPGRQGKNYMTADELREVVPDENELGERLATLEREGFASPDDVIQPMGNAGLASGETYLYGITTFADVFTQRQLITLLTMCKHVRRAWSAMRDSGMDDDRARAIAAYLAMIVNRTVDRCTSLCRWDVTAEKVQSPFVRDRLAMVWDFVEVNPFGGISGDFSSAVKWVSKVIRHCAQVDRPAEVVRGTAIDLPYADETFDAAVIDPPYYDNISYANSSDFYYVWFKRSIGDLFPEHFAGKAAPKGGEIIAAAYRHAKDKQEAADDYREQMTLALAELRRVLKADAPLVVVYAHQTTLGWATLIESLRRSGFTVGEAWPVDTEMAERRGGQENASLASSIFLVARRREADERGSWDGVSSELREVVSGRVATLPTLGITGPDLVIASIAAGLRPYTRYVSVEKPNGEDLAPDEYLEEVEREVAEAILERILVTDRRGLGRVDQETQFYVMTRFEFGDAFAPWDELNTLARGTGVELRELLNGSSPVLAFGAKRSEAKICDYRDRGADIELGRSTLDHLQRILWLADNDPKKIRDYLAVARPDPDRLRLVANALSRPGLDGSGDRNAEAEACERLLGGGVWKRLVEDNLFTAEGA